MIDMDLNQHIVVNNTTSPFHSNGFARVASGDRIGTATATSFEQRRQIDGDRQVIGEYRHSAIGSSYNVTRLKRPALTNYAATRQNEMLRKHNGQQFREPSARIYNPYA